jgi:hypothetical protein
VSKTAPSASSCAFGDKTDERSELLTRWRGDYLTISSQKELVNKAAGNDKSDRPCDKGTYLSLFENAVELGYPHLISVQRIGITDRRVGQVSDSKNFPIRG